MHSTNNRAYFYLSRYGRNLNEPKKWCNNLIWRVRSIPAANQYKAFIDSELNTLFEHQIVQACGLRVVTKQNKILALFQRMVEEEMTL